MPENISLNVSENRSVNRSVNLSEATRASQRSYFKVAVLLVIFFVISFLTNIIGPLLPDVIASFHLSLTMAAFLPFSFFIAYAVMSIPSGMIIEKWGEKPMLLGAFALALCGSLLFSLRPLYPTAILSLFLIGLGMAALQVAINPLLRVSGGEEHFAFNAVLAQLVFGSASFLSPLIYSHYATAHAGSIFENLIPANLPWVAIYWIFSIVTVAMLFLLAFVRFPKVDRIEDEKSGALETHIELIKKPVVWLYFLGIFAYVGVEQGLSNWMSQYLASAHGFNPQIEGAQAVSRFWGLITVGCCLGLLLLKVFDSRKVLLGFGAAAFVLLTGALFGTSSIALYAFPLMGFAISVMWSIIFALALNSLDKNHGTFSGILCTGIVGGAVVPLLIGTLGDGIGLKFGLCLLYLPLAYIFSMGLWARPLIQNKTILFEVTGEQGHGEIKISQA
jgi:FHS family L-fucose permease-like MFS transporter